MRLVVYKFAWNASGLVMCLVLEIEILNLLIRDYEIYSLVLQVSSMEYSARDRIPS